MKNQPYLILALLLGSATVTGCLGGDSSSGGNGSSNGDGSNGGSPGNGGTPEPGTAPEDTAVFARALMLDYATSYNDETEWATIDAAYDGGPSQQPQRMALDASILGTALASALHYMDEEVLDAGGGDEDIYDDTYHQLLGFEACQSPGSTSIDDNTVTFTDSCVVVTALDEREIVLNGEVTWDDDPEALWPTPAGKPTRLLEFENIEVDWNGQTFVINGAMADEPSDISDPNDPDASRGGLLHMVWDAEQQGTGRTFRFARRFQNTLVTPGATDDLAYHPELGAVATLLAESWYAGDSCNGGGIEDVAVRLFSDTLEDDLAVALPGCDAYSYIPEFASANLDSKGIQIRPELYELLASIDMADDTRSERTLAPDQDEHYEIAAQTGPTYLAPKEVEIGRIGGVSGNGGSDTAYQITLSLDPGDIAALGLTPDDVSAGVLRLYVASRGKDGGHGEFYFDGVEQVEWSGPPDTGDIWVDGAGEASISGHPDEPWHVAIVTSFVQTTLDESRSRVQMIASTSAVPDILIQEGEYFSGVCLREGENCAEEQLPALMLITED